MVRRESNPLYKIIVLGDGGVGKTALTIQLCLNHFVETYDPTIEDSYRKQVVIDDQPATLEVLDTAGQEEYTALRDQWVRDGEGFLLVYSITSRSSFLRIRNYYEQIERVKDRDPFALVLVGNKSDRTGERQVSQSEGEDLAKSLGPHVAFFESSAKLNINIENAFFQCARICRRLREGLIEVDSKNGSSPGPGGAYGYTGAGGANSSEDMGHVTTHDSLGRRQTPQGINTNSTSNHHHFKGNRGNNGLANGTNSQSSSPGAQRRKSDKKGKCIQM